MTELKEIRKEYHFRIMGKVKAKQSVKFGKNGVKYTPDDMVNYANWVKMSFLKEYPGHLPSELDGYNLTVQIYVYFQYPKGFSKKKIKEGKGRRGRRGGRRAGERWRGRGQDLP